MRDGSPAVEVLDASVSSDCRRWDELVDRSPEPDVYYRPGYAQASAPEGSRAVAVIVEAAGGHALCPLLLRPLREIPWASGEAGFDAITPYGYGGVLPLSGEVTPALLHAAVLRLRQWCSENAVVSCLVRLHPVLDQAAHFSGWQAPGVELKHHGPTTGIDLLAWDEAADRPAAMKPRRRSYLAACRRNLEAVSTAPGSPEFDGHLQAFVRLYEHTMQRLDAGSFYFFPERYYRALAASLRDRLLIVLAMRGLDPVGGALFFIDRAFAHYHLGGWNDQGQEYRASTFLLAAGAVEARRRGCRLLHLGGGVQGDDSLFQFKRSFGGPVFEYAYLTLVADGQAYGRLTQLRLQQAGLPARPSFFPAYRA